jgi:hypothetical protein
VGRESTVILGGTIASIFREGAGCSQRFVVVASVSGLDDPRFSADSGGRYGRGVRSDIRGLHNHTDLASTGAAELHFSQRANGFDSLHTQYLIKLAWKAV